MKAIGFWLLMTLTVLLAQPLAHASSWQFTDTDFEFGGQIVGTLEWDSSAGTMGYDFRTQCVQYAGVMSFEAQATGLSFLGDSIADPSSTPPIGTQICLPLVPSLSLIFASPLSDDDSVIQIVGGTETFLLRIADGFGNVLGLSQVVQTITSGTLVRVASIPEPGTYALMGIGLAMLSWVSRRKKRGQTMSPDAAF